MAPVLPTESPTDLPADLSAGLPTELPGPRAVHAAVAALAAGRLVIVTDDDDRENEADLVGCAATMSQADMAFMVAHTTGIVCAPMSGARCDELRLPLMVQDNTERHATAFTVTVDHASTTTGVSAADRTLTVRALSDPTVAAGEFRRPGHVFPLRARDGGVLQRAGHTEAAVDLLRLAGRPEVGVISELVGVDGNMLRGNRVTEFAQRHSLPVVAVADLVRYRRRTESLVEPSGAADIPTPYGTFRAVAYRGVLNGIEHLALVCGDVSTAEANRRGVLVRVHSECITGDVISSLRCDCGSQLRNALQAIAQDGCGAVVYLRGHEGRGIGLGHKLRAYELQEQGFDTVDANTQLGLPIDSREYGVGAQILAELGIRRIRLLSNNPAKFGGIGGYGLSIVERVPLPSEITAQNVRYLRTKRDRMGHALADQLADVEATPCYLFT